MEEWKDGGKEVRNFQEYSEKLDALVNSVTIGGVTIDDAASQIISTQYGVLQLQYEASVSKWWSSSDIKRKGIPKWVPLVAACTVYATDLAFL